MTAQIINAIEQGVGNWRMPWHTSGRFAFSPINVTSKKPYRGINTVCLWAAAQAKGYESGEWATYQQWQEHGAQVRKGEKATTVVFWKFANDCGREQDDERNSSPARSRLLFTRGYSVFNAAQVDGYTPKAERGNADAGTHRTRRRVLSSHRCRSAARRKPSVLRARFGSHSDAAFPAFRENVSYYSTLAHEHTHWTAKHGRCDRQLGKRFGDNAYAAEELIAELGAAFTCAHLGTEH